MTILRTLALTLSLCAPLSIFAEVVQPSDSNEDKKGSFNLSMQPQQELSPEAIKTILEKKLPGIEITSIEASPKDGIYQVFYGGQILYISNDGHFVFTGNMLGISGSSPVNHTESALAVKAAELAPKRAEMIAAIKEEDMVVFKADKEEYAITVFTDVDCGYCRKLHKEVPEMNKNGITVRYLAFPRAGVGSSAYDKLVSVWCADDKTAAMDDAKLKRKFEPKTCTNPIESQYNLTRKFGLTGTPALVLSDGELISGYLPFKKLQAHLQNKFDKQQEKTVSEKMDQEPQA